MSSTSESRAATDLSEFLAYGLERAVKQSRYGGVVAAESGRAESALFRLHMTSFAVYNGLVGSLLLHREQDGPKGLVLYVVAMALHFLVNDYGLRQDHRAAYHRVGRWLLAAAVCVGWLAGTVSRVPEAASLLLFSFLAGGIILNTLKEELPEERRSRFWAFLLGSSGYAALLVAP